MTFLFLIGKSNEVRAFPFVFYNHKEKAGPILLSNPRLPKTGPPLLLRISFAGFAGFFSDNRCYFRC